MISGAKPRRPGWLWNPSTASTGKNSPAPEISDNLNTTDMGNLGLTAGDEAAIVLFMKTLSDRL